MLLMLPNNYLKEYIWSENCFNRVYYRTVMITPQEHDIEEQELLITETLDRR